MRLYSFSWKKKKRSHTDPSHVSPSARYLAKHLRNANSHLLREACEAKYLSWKQKPNEEHTQSLSRWTYLTLLCPTAFNAWVIILLRVCVCEDHHTNEYYKEVYPETWMSWQAGTNSKKAATIQWINCLHSSENHLKNAANWKELGSQRSWGINVANKAGRKSETPPGTFYHIAQTHSGCYS